MSDRRVTLTLKLQPGPDDDLILWWQTVPMGKGQALLKGILRQALQQPSKELSMADVVQQLAQEIQGLRRMLTAAVGRETIQGEPRSEASGLSEPERARRGARIARSSW
ncbi:hypothetical protein TFLX_05723 [Thermoflexales bacterium]|nr:hypothetical protein TFLX_05723 [Thermoflexales bacterium]